MRLTPAIVLLKYISQNMSSVRELWTSITAATNNTVDLFFYEVRHILYQISYPN